MFIEIDVSELLCLMSVIFENIFLFVQLQKQLKCKTHWQSSYMVFQNGICQHLTGWVDHYIELEFCTKGPVVHLCDKWMSIGVIENLHFLNWNVFINFYFYSLNWVFFFFTIFFSANYNVVKWSKWVTTYTDQLQIPISVLKEKAFSQKYMLS